MMIDENRSAPTGKEIRLFGLLLLIFFALVAAISYYKPEALFGGAIFMAIAWTIGFLLGGGNRLRKLPGIGLPILFAIAGNGEMLGLSAFTIMAGCAAIGLLGALVVWALPRAGRVLYDGWIEGASPIGWTVTHLVLAAVYYLVLTPIGLLMRLAGRDPMRRTIDPNAATYWIERKNPIESKRYFRQF
jgi:hypothetical protein